MDNYETIKMNLDKPVCTISLNRPKVHNAFNALMIRELIQALKQAESDTSIRVVLITASGHHFCSGADLQWMKAMADYDMAQNKSDALTLAHLLQQLANLSKPTIALVHGRVMGGGCGLAACCDLVIASQDTRFCFSEVKLGLIPATIAPYVIRRIGFNAARRYFITAELMGSDTAQTLQLVDQIVSDEILLSTGHALALQICQNGPQAIREIKKLLNIIVPIDNFMIESTANQLAEIRSSTEAKEGLEAFLQKRQPNWTTLLKNQ